MTVLDIITLPEPVLRKKARKVSQYSNELHTLIDDMVETMRAAPGVGLAAPQVNVQLRVIVVEFGDEEDEEIPPKLYIIVNPELSKFSQELVTGTEGCLSIPGYVGEVERSKTVIVKGFNRQGNPLKIKAKGWLARIFQHEVDHLDGILYIDRSDKVLAIEEEPTQVSPPD